MMERSDHLPKKLRLQWLYDTCPICGKDYPYLPTYKPGHCGRFDCIYELAMRELKKEGKI